MAGHDIIVIGASAGAEDALMRLGAQLPRRLGAAVFVACHMAPDAQGTVVIPLAALGNLHTRTAEDRDRIHDGFMYVAPPGHHMLINRKRVRIFIGARWVTRWRPGIDAMFRSAAVAHGSRVIGVILTGMLDDGAEGMAAIKQCGGITMVQDPLDAAYPGMPQSALARTQIDYTLPLATMGAELVRLVTEPARRSGRAPAALCSAARRVERLMQPDPRLDSPWLS